MIFPLAAKSLIVESSDQSEPGRPGHGDNILPFFVALKYLERQLLELSIGSLMFIYVPHSEYSIYTIYGISNQQPVAKRWLAVLRPPNEGRASPHLRVHPFALL